MPKRSEQNDIHTNLADVVIAKARATVQEIDERISSAADVPNLSISILSEMKNSLTRGIDELIEEKNSLNDNYSFRKDHKETMAKVTSNPLKVVGGLFLHPIKAVRTLKELSDSSDSTKKQFDQALISCQRCIQELFDRVALIKVQLQQLVKGMDLLSEVKIQSLDNEAPVPIASEIKADEDEFNEDELAELAQLNNAQKVSHKDIESAISLERLRACPVDYIDSRPEMDNKVENKEENSQKLKL